MNKMAFIVFAMLICNVPATLSAQQIDMAGAQISSSVFDIGRPQNCFDNNPNTFMRSAAVNPAYVQIRFDHAVSVNSVKVLVGQVGYEWAEEDLWWLEAADNEKDLITKRRTYKRIVPARNPVGGIFDQVRLPYNFSKRIWRFNVKRLIGDDYVHIVELQLWYDTHAEYNPFGMLDVSDGRIRTDKYDIGTPMDCFDDKLSTLLRSASVNPFKITLSFPRPKDLNRVEAFLGQPGYAWAESDDWMLVGANSMKDLILRKGSYEEIIPKRGGVAAGWDVVPINRTVSKKIYRFIITRIVGDNYVHVPELKLFNDPPLLTRSLLILVDDSVRAALTADLNLFSEDLQHEGYAAIIHEYTGNGNDPDAVKHLIQTYYESEENLVGVLLIGDIPFARAMCNWGCAPGYSDLFYMDLDGNWIASGDGVYQAITGDRNPEIYSGRLFGSSLVQNLDEEVALYRNYLSRNHFYRRGYTKRSNKALYYVADFVEEDAIAENNLKKLYRKVVRVTSHGQDVREYLYPELFKPYEYIHITAHSNSYGWNNLSYHDVQQIQPQALFYNTHGCSTARFTENNYIGGVALFKANGLFYVGSTTWAYYTPEMDVALTSSLAGGAAVGEALMDIFDHRFAVSPETSLQWKGQELIILGDPTLRVR